MKYKAIIETDEFKDFEFYEDGIGKFMVGKDAGATADGGWMPLYFTKCEQESCEDAISREQAKVAIRDRFKDLPSRVEINTILNELPSVIPQTKTGHWIDTGSGQECSECGEIQHGYDNFRFYCAKCGSKNVIESEK